MNQGSGWTWDQAANVSTVIALTLTVVGLIYAGRQFSHGRRAPAAALLTIQESFRQAWARFVDVPEGAADRRYATLSEVMNLIEIGCALHEEQIFVGRVAEMFEGYLCDVLALINDSPSAKALVEQMLHDRVTFEHILAFVAAHRERVKIKIDPPNLEEAA